MKYIFSLLILMFSLGAFAQVQKAKDDLPENKINPNPKAKQPAAFDRKMHEAKTNKRTIQNRDKRRKKHLQKEQAEMDNKKQ